MTLFLSVILAFIFDKLFGEPKRFHPLVGFGYYVSAIEKRLNRSPEACSHNLSMLKGLFAVFLAIAPWLVTSIVLMFAISELPILSVFIAGFILYLAVGWQSLLLHAKQVAIPLAEGDLEQARYYVSWIVSRDTEQLDEKEVAKAATESVLENGADAIFAALFWFCLLGIPGVVLYRCANTLDAMWGYKNERFLSFGWAAARLDDVLNYVPARLTALSYSLLATSGHRFQAFKCWREQGYIGKSPNAGPVMATGAGALNVSLGGAASYHNRIEQKPVLGPEETASTLATSQAIYAACGLINRTLAAWVLVILVISLLERMKILG